MAANNDAQSRTRRMHTRTLTTTTKKRNSSSAAFFSSHDKQLLAVCLCPLSRDVDREDFVPR